MIADPVFADMLATEEPEHPETDHHSHNEDSPGHSHNHGHDHNHDGGGPSKNRHAAQDKVRSTLRSFVRDWSEPGAGEREACYSPCLTALEGHFSASSNSESTATRERGDIKVLVPGCGLGRLTMEVAARGMLPIIRRREGELMVRVCFAGQ
jgi:carnosine N-methyltransferase